VSQCGVLNKGRNEETSGRQAHPLLLLVSHHEDSEFTEAEEAAANKLEIRNGRSQECTEYPEADSMCVRVGRAAAWERGGRLGWAVGSHS
jgi:hypothetical protein